MPFIREIIEKPIILDYLERRNLLLQYKKSKSYILSGNIISTDLKKRVPKDSNVWYFRINRQFRALGYIEDKVLYIYKIDNHQ